MADYPITNVARRIVYTGSAGVGPYAFSFPVLTSTDIAVYKNTTLLTLTTDYTVSISGTTGEGSVTLVVAATGSDRITIVGARAIQRSTDFVTGGDFFANTLNTELDSEVIFVQQVAETAERSLKAPVTDPTSIDMTLPVNTARANKFLSFNSTGNPQALDAIGAYKGNWAASVAYVLQDIVKDTSNSNIYICITAHTSSGSQPISSNADVAKWSLVVDAAAAATSATNAASSASAASTSATNAASSASAASTSASNASTSATTASTQASNASTSATAAASSASAASSSATSASGSASTATTQASNASTSATNAASSASAASTSASNASTSASNASTSASAASTSATAASGSASTATTQASNASTSATNAAASASSASTAQTAAEAARDATLTAYDNFDDRYLGAKSSAPTLDNDGNALVGGALYFDTVAQGMYVYTGTAWTAAYISGAGYLAAANNLSELTNTANARTNLGLVIGTNVQAYDAELAAIAGLVSAANKGIQFTGSGTAATYDLTAAGKALLDDADASAQRTTLGLGSVATESTVPVSKGGTGSTTLTANNVILGNGTSTPNFVAPGSSGNVLTSNGTTWTSAAAAAFDSGTVMLFGQTAAPTGWTKDTTNYNNHALRIVTGTASTGGSVDFTTAFASQTPTGSVTITSVTGTAGATTLTTPQIPSHNHGQTANSGGPFGVTGNQLVSAANPFPVSNSTTSTGGGGSHDHPFSFSSGSGSFSGSAINLAVKYVDIIRATKN